MAPAAVLVQLKTYSQPRSCSTNPRPVGIHAALVTANDSQISVATQAGCACHVHIDWSSVRSSRSWFRHPNSIKSHLSTLQMPWILLPVSVQDQDRRSTVLIVRVEVFRACQLPIRMSFDSIFERMAIGKVEVLGVSRGRTQLEPYQGKLRSHSAPRSLWAAKLGQQTVLCDDRCMQAILLCAQSTIHHVCKGQRTSHSRRPPICRGRRRGRYHKQHDRPGQCAGH